MAIDASYALGHGGAPAGTLVDYFPFSSFLSMLSFFVLTVSLVKYLPNWIARSHSLKFARDWKWAIQQIHNAPFAAVEKEIVSIPFACPIMLRLFQEEGKAQPSFIHTLLEGNSLKAANGEAISFDLDDIKGAAGAIYAAGQDTVSEHDHFLLLPYTYIICRLGQHS